MSCRFSLTIFIPGGVFSTSRPVNCSELPNETSHNLVTFPKKALAKFGISQIRERPFVVSMVTNLSRAVQYLKMIKINKRDKNLKLLPLLTESIYSLQIFSEHLWLLLKSKNSYLCHVTKLMTSSGLFQLTSYRKKYFYAFDQCFRQFPDKAGKYVRELFLSFP